MRLYRGDACTGGTQPYCIGAPNSFSSGGGEIHALGSLSIAGNSMTLEARQCPPNQPGVFFYGQTQAMFAFGDGFVCVGSPRVRLNPPNFTKGQGLANRALGFASAPINGGLGQITPGITWNFQYWVRDPGGPGGTGHNLTDGVAIVFCP